MLEFAVYGLELPHQHRQLLSFFGVGTTRSRYLTANMPYDHCCLHSAMHQIIFLISFSPQMADTKTIFWAIVVIKQKYVAPKNVKQFCASCRNEQTMHMAHENLTLLCEFKTSYWIPNSRLSFKPKRERTKRNNYCRRNVTLHLKNK